MVSKKIKIFGILLLVCLVLGCVGQQTVKADSGRFTELAHGNINGGTITVVHDNVNNVTLYFSQVYGGSAVTAIPDWQLKAPKQMA
jgi:hypothetical protein